MRTVFLDTVGLLALWNANDQWHDSAVTAFTDLQQHPFQFVSTSHVLFECGNAAARTPFRSDICDVWQQLDSKGDLIRPSLGDEQVAWAAYARGDAGHAGIVDQVSFVIMRRLGLTEAFSNDRHFSAAGFSTLF